MTIQIKLLGAPSIRSEGVERVLRGRKAWALLAYLLLGPSHSSRGHLAELLFAEADDPIRALRWNLTELRHALDRATIPPKDPIAIGLPPGAYVDAVALRKQGWSAALEMADLDRDLLEGATFAGLPIFEAWLLNHRRQLRACAADVLREAVLGSLAGAETDRAVDAAVRLVALDPLNEADQALLIRAYAAAGDTASAAKQFAGFTNLLRAELGVEPGPEVAAAVQAPRAGVVRAPVGGKHAVRAQLEAGSAAVRAGALDAGVDCLRRAASEAHSIGEVDLLVDTLLTLGSTLAHAGRARHQEGAAALHGALAAARRAGRADAAASAQMELAWIEFMTARYDRATRWVEAALADAGDQLQIRCLGSWIRGKCSMEIGDYTASLDDLREAVDLAHELADPARRSFCLASLGRTHLLMRSLGEARDSLQRSIEVGTVHGFVWTMPLAQSFLGEVAVFEGDLTKGESLAEKAFASARQVGDASFEAFALHARGTVARARHDYEEAARWMRSARDVLLATPDCEWALAYSLDGLADVGSAGGISSARDWIDDLETLAGRHGMKELVARAYLFRSRMGASEALEIARSQAAEVDNPALHALLAQAPVAP